MGADGVEGGAVCLQWSRHRFCCLVSVSGSAWLRGREFCWIMSVCGTAMAMCGVLLTWRYWKAADGLIDVLWCFEEKMFGAPVYARTEENDVQSGGYTHRNDGFSSDWIVELNSVYTGNLDSKNVHTEKINIYTG
ncbi:hypothetical protein CPB84DRAFT_1748857 [Gymnopilus junonius]|uniref:Uncharacterized protein n=1 Tax=Gymnopilus junonius TaxID=109634 RepID=A0A9P5NJ41_GYMJU|nr:hypothetical protein CPB84DRAFT_1748857 [Gymnopilus junonius]